MRQYLRRSGPAGLCLLFLILATSGAAQAAVQSLEPRLLSPAPVGLNSLIFTYLYSSGDVILGNSIPLEGTTARANSVAAIYIRSIGILGKAGRLTVVVPLANGKWSGEFSGVDTSTTRTGFGDPVIGIGMGLVGTPALRAKNMATFRPGTMLGGGLRVSIPIGQYDSSRFFNLGTNRWLFTPGIAAMRYMGRWGFEAQLRATFSTTNSEFYGSTEVGQEPLVGFQFHVEYTFKRGLWAAASFGQSFGGATVVDGESQGNDQTNNRFALTLDYPLGKAWSVKGAYTGGISTRYGGDFNTFALGFQHHWGGM